MAPTKAIRTYRNNNKKPGSKLALDNLLAHNLRKRLEINSPGSSKDKSSESTFDRLLNGEVYNNVVFKKFPDNNFNTFEDSASSLFSRSNDCLNENNRKELRRSDQKSALNLCPIVVLKKNLESSLSQENDKTETPKHHKDEEKSVPCTSNYSIDISYPEGTEEDRNDKIVAENLQEVDNVITQLHNCQKIVLMESLELHTTKNESNYLNFRNSVDAVSTPHTRSNIYYLRKNRRKKSEDFQNLSIPASTPSDQERGKFSVEYYHKLQSQIEDLSLSRNEILQGKQLKIRNSNISAGNDMQETENNDIFEVEGYREYHQASTPQSVKSIRVQNQTSASLLSESLRIINEWSNRCPTPNSFNNTIHNIFKCKSRSQGSLNISKRKRDTKLFKKSRVILKHNPHLEKIIKESLRNMTPHNIEFLNVRSILSNCDSRRRKRSSMKDIATLKNCAVHLTPLRIYELKTHSGSPEIIEISSGSSESSSHISNTSHSSFGSDRQMSPEAESLKLPKVGIPMESEQQRSKSSSHLSESDTSHSSFDSNREMYQMESEQQINNLSDLRGLISNEVGNMNVGTRLNHKCSKLCEHFRIIPKVMLQRCDFSKYKIAKKSRYSDTNDLADSLSINTSQDEFRGFGADSDFNNSDLVEPEGSEIQMNKTLPRENDDLNYDFKTKDYCTGKVIERNADKFKMKECFVKLDRMVINTRNNENKQLMLKANEHKKKFSGCWVILNGDKKGKESLLPTSVNYVQEHLDGSGLLKPKSRQNSLANISLPNNHSLIDEFRETPVRIREFVSLAPGKKFRRSMAVFKKHLDDSGKSPSSSRITVHRRQSIKLIPLLPKINKISELASVALNNSGYVSLRPSFRRSSLEKVEHHLPNIQPVENYHNFITKNSDNQLTARDIVLKRCGQTEPLKFEKCYPKSALQHCQKIGEGVFGEVFMIRDKDGSTTVMKVIPIEGEQIVNLEKQKTFEGIISEIIISMELSNLEKTKRNNTDAFVKVKGVRCVQGCYPDRLLELWELYDENKQSENDSPEIFLEDQQYIVIELANAGQDLEAFQFNNAQQALAVFEQVTCALAVAESELQFEHRDLHWGNVLITTTEQQNTVFVIDGKEIIVNNRGIKATIIDFTLSRVEYEGVIIFNDLSMDEDLFTAKGDYQFDVYRKMQENNGNQWQDFKPYSNVLWLHYILDKAMKGFRYRNPKSKLHKIGLATLRAYEQKILESNSAIDFVLNNFISNILIE